MSILVDDISATLDSISAVAGGVGGFVVSTQFSGEEDSRLGFVTVRVPADQLDSVLDQIRDMAVRVLTEHSSSQDVTEEYVDLDARVRNLERAEQQFLGILERAETIEDTLNVQRELTSIQGQLEQLKGRMQYLERTSATSLISVELRPASSPQALVEPGWRPLETAKETVRGLSGFGQGLADFAIRLVIFAPVWLPILVAGWWLWRRDQRVRRWVSGGRPPIPPQENGPRQ
jgi:vacuolar-type H+-ATPase subunit I/STV1